MKDDRANTGVLAVAATMMIVAGLLVVAFVGPYLVQMIDTDPGPSATGAYRLGPAGATRGYGALRFQTDKDIEFSGARFKLWYVSHGGSMPPVGATCAVDAWIRQDGIFAGRRDVLLDFEGQHITVNVVGYSEVFMSADEDVTITSGTYLFEVYVSDCMYSVVHIMWYASRSNEGSGGDGVAALSDETGIGIYNVDATQWFQALLYGNEVSGMPPPPPTQPPTNQTDNKTNVKTTTSDYDDGMGYDDMWWLPYLIILLIVLIFIAVFWAIIRLMG